MIATTANASVIPSDPYRLLKMLLKAVAVLGLLYFLARKGMISISVSGTGRALRDWRHMVPATILIVLSALLGVIRWQWLLGAQEIQLRWVRTAQLTFIGNFFNIALPGAVSGDFVKAFYVGKEIPGKRARAFGAILFDRVAGLSALVLLSAGAFLIGYDRFRGTALVAGVRVVMTLAALGVVVFYAYLFLVREEHDPVLWFLRRMETRMPKFGAVTRIYLGLRHYHHYRSMVLRVLLLSVVVHLMVGGACYLMAQALGDAGALPLIGVYVIVPLGLLVTAVPVMPAGVGTGHAAFFYLFKLLGSERGADIFTLYALMMISLGAVGGLVYMRFKAHEGGVDI